MLWCAHSRVGHFCFVGKILPQHVDLVLVRDIVQHLSVKDIFRLFENIREFVKPKRVLVTSYNTTDENVDLGSYIGGSSSLFSQLSNRAPGYNLFLPPFQLDPSRIRNIFQDKPEGTDKAPPSVLLDIDPGKDISDTD